MKTLIIIRFAVISLPASLQAAVSLPYNTDFSDSTIGASQPLGWDNASGGGTSTITASNEFQMDSGGASSRFTLFTPDPVIGRTAGNGFRLTTSFNYTSGDGQFENTALFFFASGTGSPRLIVNGGTNNAGSLEFSGLSTTSNGSMTSSEFYALEMAGALFSIEMTGIFQGDGSLNVSAVLSNDQNSSTVTSSATWAIPTTDIKFGIRTAAGGSGSGHSSVATYQTYSLEAIPEPSALVLVAGGVLLALGMRRRVS